MRPCVLSTAGLLAAPHRSSSTYTYRRLLWSFLWLKKKLLLLISPLMFLS